MKRYWLAGAPEVLGQVGCLGQGSYGIGEGLLSFPGRYCLDHIHGNLWTLNLSLTVVECAIPNKRL